MEISCRSPQQIDEDFMISELEGLKKALSKCRGRIQGLQGTVAGDFPVQLAHRRLHLKISCHPRIYANATKRAD